MLGGESKGQKYTNGLTTCFYDLVHLVKNACYILSFQIV